LKKQIKGDYRRWKDLQCSWIGRINIVKTATLPKSVYMFNAIPINIPMTVITEIENSTLKFIWKQNTMNSQGKNKQKEHCWRYLSTDIKLYYRAIAIQTVWYQYINRHEDKWNRIDGPDMNPHSYAHVIFDKGSKNI
jgi:hypothetical protein